MTYKDTAYNIATALAPGGSRSESAAARRRRAALRLPLSEWARENAEADGAAPSLETIVENHILHVRAAAADLRDAIESWEHADETWPDDFAREIAYAADALLRAIGEAAPDAL